MWMQYKLQHSVDEVNIESAVENLAEEMHALSMDSLHAVNYDIDYCFDDEAQEKLMDDHHKYLVGVNLCNKFLHKVLDLEEFCELMVRIDLKRFLYAIEKYLPAYIIEKYKLHQSQDEGFIDNNTEEDGHAGGDVFHV